MSDKLPPLPPLSAIQDPAVRAALQAIYDRLRVATGEVGTRPFLTETEVKNLIQSANR